MENSSPEANNKARLEWISGTYFGSLNREKSSALDQLHSATNWGLTLITTAFVLVVTRSTFPDSISLYVLIVAFLMGTHFFSRAIKGYINVIRWALLQNVITEAQTSTSTENIPQLVEDYHLNWNLPLTRRDVVFKGLTELGYGYILLFVLIALVYTAMQITVTNGHMAAIVVGAIFVLGEIVLLLRSPYMRTAKPHPTARRIR